MPATCSRLTLLSAPLLALLAPLSLGPRPEARATDRAKDEPRALKVEDEGCGFCMEFARIPATGEAGFLMGASEREQLESIGDRAEVWGKVQPWMEAVYRQEGPRHKVVISKPFYLGKYEVTQRQWKALMGKDSNPSYYRRDGSGKDDIKDVKDEELDSFPVEYVTWQDAQDFLKKLNALAKRRKIRMTFRLPTEAEWEYACRGGADNKEPFDLEGKPSKSISHHQANFDSTQPYGPGGKGGEPLRRTCKVGSYKPNAFGLYDMHGNVWEYCSDWHSGTTYTKGPRTDPTGPSKGKDRVLRGGCWFHPGEHCRAASRWLAEPSFRNRDVGFRVAATPAK